MSEIAKHGMSNIKNAASATFQDIDKVDILPECLKACNTSIQTRKTRELTRDKRPAFCRFVDTVSKNANILKFFSRHFAFMGFSVL